MLRYNRRINFNSIINVLIFIGVTVTFYSYIFYQRILNLFNLFLTFALSFLLLFLLPLVFPYVLGKKKLKV
ncbi:hypothetical protein A2W14_02055 [Candidatus Gottesmanbacteria bacterium RBG_16_37_8]|uniref:Uncharacterized protein n=1 Tax=Candidatus Gottesmanbacteria bacterium RBG_16_37_8 TaxID=1798371 RepID=A0A1F5YSR5_9BACT|nr:MAG: hypothetical protein A2W14_02055 [Candidatus Gottesmanbacteria bacterium RBG_16_37_8]